MANKFRFRPDGTESSSIYKGAWAIDLTPNDIGGGPSIGTGLYNGAHVPEGGYAIYTPGEVYVALNDLELTEYITGLGGDGTNRATALTWASVQENVAVATTNMTEIVTDGLLLNFSPGNNMSFVDNQPTSNLNPYVLVTSGTDGSGQGSVGKRLNLAANHVRIFDVNSNTRQSHLISGLSAGTYTASIEFKKLSGTPTFRFQIQGYVNSSYNRTIKFTDTAEIGIEDKGGWQTASWTFDLTGSENAVRIWYQDGADYTTYTHSFELRNPQLESGSVATPYHIATRNQTTDIHDLGAHNAHGSLVNGVSLHSDGYLELDGVDDKITIPNTNDIFSIGTAPFSLNLWVKQGVATTYPHLFTIRDQQHFTLKAIRGDATDGYQLYVYQGGAIMFENSYLDPDNWQMITLTRDGGLHKLYINGVLSDEVQSTAKNIEPNEAYLGHGWGGEYTEQKRGDVQLYNRVLDPSEILQNYHEGDVETNGLVVNLDAKNLVSYPREGSVWKDLTQNRHSVLLRNEAPYNKEGYISFDGIDQYADFSSVHRFNTGEGIGSNYTFEVWFKMRTLPTANYGPNGHIWGGQNGNDLVLYLNPVDANGISKGNMVYDDARYTESHMTTGGFRANEWNQWVIVGDGVNHTLTHYINGELDRLDSPVQSSQREKTWDSERFAHDTRWGTFSELDLAIARQYNLKLSAEQVKKNFRAHRNRFGI